LLHFTAMILIWLIFCLFLIFILKKAYVFLINKNKLFLWLILFFIIFSIFLYFNIKQVDCMGPPSGYVPARKEEYIALWNRNISPEGIAAYLAQDDSLVDSIHPLSSNNPSEGPYSFNSSEERSCETYIKLLSISLTVFSVFFLGQF